MSELVIGPGCEVTLYFSLALIDGAIIDSNFDTLPATFTLGDGSLLPGFERLLLGLEAGALETFSVSPEEGFGARNPDNAHRIPRRQFAADLPLSEGLVMSFADANQAETAGVVMSIDGDYVDVDFNHPLAGRAIIFRVKIEAVRQRRINLVPDWESGHVRSGDTG